MSETSCLKCRNAFPPHELFAVPGGRICGPCQVDSEEVAEQGSLKGNPLMIAAAIGAGVPMVFSMHSSSSQTVNGVVTHFEYRDWPAVIGGATALIFGLLLVIQVVRKKLSPSKLGYVALGLVLLAGGRHVARGLGAFATPPAASGADTLSDNQP